MNIHIQWQFLSHYEGEVDTQCDPSWIKDEGTGSTLMLSLSLSLSLSGCP